MHVRRRRRATPTFLALLALPGVASPVLGEGAPLGTRENPLRVREEMARQFRIRAEEIAAADLERHLTITGVVKADENKLVRITTVAPGRVREVMVFPGDRVERLETLALIDSAELARQKGEYLIARAQVDLAQHMLRLEQKWAKLEVDARKSLDLATEDLNRARTALQVANAQLEVTRRKFEAEEDLYEHGITSKQALDQAKANFTKADSERRKARSDLALAQRRFDRERSAYDEKILPTRELQQSEARLVQAEIQLQAARNNLSIYGIKPTTSTVELEQEYITKNKVVTPLAGTVLDRNVRVGDVVPPERFLFEVADLSSVWFHGNLYEKDAVLVGAGSDVRVRVPAFEHDFPGKVMRVSPVVDPVTRTVPCIVYVPNDDRLLRPGMFGKGAIRVERSRPRLLVSRSALQELDGRWLVFLRTGLAGGEVTYETREVEVGFEFEVPGPDGEDPVRKVEVTRGLVAGDPVVIEGAFSLVSELRKRGGAE